MRREGVKPEMNVTPLVDVVLVLLIIFMVITPQMEKGPTVDVPTVLNPDAKTQVANDPVTVKITAEGELWIEEDALDDEDLLARLTQIHADEPERKVVLKADRATPYASVRSIMKQAQQIGFRGVALQVGERKEGG